MKLKDFGEKRLVNEIVIPLFSGQDLPVGVGDDAAILDLGLEKNIVISVDFVAEKLIALEKGWMNFRELGAYTVTSNISDIASMGAEPVAVLLSMGMKQDLLVDDFKDFLLGAKEQAEEYGVKIVGGDIGNTTVNLFTGVALGVIEKGKGLTRSGFNVGDLVCTTGHIGLFSTALAYLLFAKKASLDKEAEDTLKKAIVRPHAKIKQARALTELGACTACQDITDGFSETVHEMTLGTREKFILNSTQLPIHEATLAVAQLLNMNPIDVCFGPGSGFELVFTISKDRLQDVESAFTAIGEKIYVVGRVKNRDKNYIIIDGIEKELIPQQFENFKGGDEDFIKNQLRGGKK